jgi:hypothetical protein
MLDHDAGAVNIFVGAESLPEKKCLSNVRQAGKETNEVRVPVGHKLKHMFTVGKSNQTGSIGKIDCLDGSY